MKKYLPLIIMFVFVLVVAFAINYVYKGAYKSALDNTLQGIGGPSILFNRFDTIASTSAQTLTAGAEIQIVASSSKRAYLEISNTSQIGSSVYLSIDSDKAAVDGSGIFINASSTYQMIPGQNLYSGAIRAISTSGATISVLEVNSDN